MISFPCFSQQYSAVRHHTKYYFLAFLHTTLLVCATRCHYPLITFYPLYTFIWFDIEVQLQQITTKNQEKIDCWHYNRLPTPTGGILANSIILLIRLTSFQLPRIAMCLFISRSCSISILPPIFDKFPKRTVNEGGKEKYRPHSSPLAGSKIKEIIGYCAVFSTSVYTMDVTGLYS